VLFITFFQEKEGKMLFFAYSQCMVKKLSVCLRETDDLGMKNMHEFSNVLLVIIGKICFILPIMTFRYAKSSTLDDEKLYFVW